MELEESDLSLSDGDESKNENQNEFDVSQSAIKRPKLLDNEQLNKS